MKKILLLVITISMLGGVGCSSNEEKTEAVSEEKDNEQITKIYLADDVIKNIEESLNIFTEGTAFEESTYKIELDKNDLKISVIKPIADIMISYEAATSDETVEAIKKFLIFDNVYDSIKEEIGLEFDCIQVLIFNGEEELNNNEYYTLKTIM